MWRVFLRFSALNRALRPSHQWSVAPHVEYELLCRGLALSHLRYRSWFHPRFEGLAMGSMTVAVHVCTDGISRHARARCTPYFADGLIFVHGSSAVVPVQTHHDSVFQACLNSCTSPFVIVRLQLLTTGFGLNNFAGSSEGRPTCCGMSRIAVGF